MTRPAELRGFEVLYSLNLLIGLGQTALRWPDQAQIVSPVVMIVVQGVMVALLFIAMLMVSRRGNKMALWLIVALFAAGLPAYVRMAMQGRIGTGELVMIARGLCQALALALAFTPAARAWMSGGRTQAGE